MIRKGVTEAEQRARPWEKTGRDEPKHQCFPWPSARSRKTPGLELEDHLGEGQESRVLSGGGVAGVV